MNHLLTSFPPKISISLISQRNNATGLTRHRANT
jgi:hypothetical protein